MYAINENETVNRYGYIVSKKEVYESYLNNEILELEKKITDEFIEIASDSTIFLRESKIDFVEQKEFLEQIKKVKAVCKDRNVKLININKLVKSIKDNYDNYVNEYKQYNDNFNSASKIWKDYDLRVGYSDDFYYSEVLRPLGFSLDYAKNKKISEVKNVYNKLLSLELEVNSIHNNYISVSVNSLDILK